MTDLDLIRDELAGLRVAIGYSSQPDNVLKILVVALERAVAGLEKYKDTYWLGPSIQAGDWATADLKQHYEAQQALADIAEILGKDEK